MMGGGESAAIRPMLDDSFLLMPHDVHEPTAGRAETFANRRYVDVTVVGPILTVWVTVDWGVTTMDGKLVTIEDWPLRLQIDRRGGARGTRVLSMGPAARIDDGTLSNGVYVHDTLKVDLVVPHQVMLERDQRELTELQIVCTHTEYKKVEFAVVGFYAEAGADPQLVKHKLTMGAISARRTRSKGHSNEPYGPEGRQLLAEVWDWAYR